jgi:hypothetical protein
LIEADAHDGAVAYRPHAGGAGLHLDPLAPPRMKRDRHHYALSYIYEFGRLDPHGVEGLESPEAVKESAHLIQVVHTTAGAGRAREVELAVWRCGLERGVPVPTVECVDRGADHLDCLLGHRLLRHPDRFERLAGIWEDPKGEHKAVSERPQVAVPILDLSGGPLGPNASPDDGHYLLSSFDELLGLDMPELKWRELLAKNRPYHVAAGHRRDLPPPAPATIYELTETGNRLGPAILALGQVGLATLGSPQPGEDVRPERLVIGIRVSFRREEFADLTETYELVIDDEPFTVEVNDGVVETRPGGASSPSVSLDTDADTFIALMTGRASAADSLATGRATLEGERSELERFIDAFGYPSAQPAAT